jgi:serine/threonine protein phosphatase PrpC
VTGVATRPGDLIVVATDGLFDNVELDEVNRRFARS